MGIEFYYMFSSPPSRAVMLLAKQIGIELQLKPLDLLKGEQLTPEFLAINPQHTVPTIVDRDNNNFTLWESYSIMEYLVDKYTAGHEYFPKDPDRRPQINKWFHFDNGIFFPAIKAVIMATYLGAGADAEMEKKLKEAFELFEKLLVHQGTQFAAGDNVTLADLSLACSVDLPVVLKLVDLSEYNQIDAWYKRVKETVPGYHEICEEPLAAFPSLLEKFKEDAGKK